MGIKPRPTHPCPTCGSHKVDLISAFSEGNLYGCTVCLTGFMTDGETVRVLPRPGSQPTG